MESFHETLRAKRFKPRTKRRLFKFCVNKIVKVEPEGNQRQGTRCPKPRSGHRVVVNGGNVYSFGGFNPRSDGDDEDPPHVGVIFKELWKFNCASRTWTKLETSGTMPEELASHSAVLINNYMLIFGGTGVPFGENSSNSAHVCNLDTLEWSTLQTTGCLPLGQYGQATAVHQNKMYIVGGTTGYRYFMTVHCLDLSTKEWKLLENDKLNSKPEPRYRHEIAIEGNQIFVFGGGTESVCFGFKEVPVFNLDDYTWQSFPTSEEYPVARRRHGCVQIGSEVFICGGEDGSRILSDVWKINLKTLQWEKLLITLPTPVYFHSAAISHAGQLFVFGGVNSITENSRTNELFSMWVIIPSLAEMCWQAILYYIPYIARLRRDKLFEAGVPVHFLSQIDFESSFEREIKNCCNRLQS